MKLLLLTVMIILGFASCASHEQNDDYYDRANRANDKAQADLNK